MKKSKIPIIVFAVGVAYGLFALIHYEYAKTAAGYDWWLYSGIAAIIIAVLFAAVGYASQGKR